MGEMFQWYDSDRDIEETGGKIGLALANIVMEERRNKVLDCMETSNIPLTNTRKRVASDNTYEVFLQEADKINFNDINSMRNVLPVFFGRRFGEEGKTPISRMENYQVFGAYRGMVSYAKRRINKNH